MLRKIISVLYRNSFAFVLGMLFTFLLGIAFWASIVTAIVESSNMTYDYMLERMTVLQIEAYETQ